MQSYKAVRASIYVLAALLLIGAAPEAEAQAGPDLRTTGKKMDLSQLRALPQTNRVVVKFREGEKVRLTKDKLTGMRSGQANLLNNVLSQAGVSQAAMKPLSSSTANRVFAICVSRGTPRKVACPATASISSSG